MNTIPSSCSISIWKQCSTLQRAFCQEGSVVKDTCRERDRRLRPEKSEPSGCSDSMADPRNTGSGGWPACPRTLKDGTRKDDTHTRVSRWSSARCALWRSQEDGIRYSLPGTWIVTYSQGPRAWVRLVRSLAQRWLSHTISPPFSARSRMGRFY